ncbi:MAG: tetratricopeptide repeat protein [Pseudomonadota bacterium]
MTLKLQTIAAAFAMLTAVNAAQGEGLGAHPPMFLVQAEYALEAGDTTRAIELLNKRYKRLRNPAYRVRGLAVLCSAHLQDQDFERAFRPCESATEMKQAGWSDFNNQGVLELHLGRFDEALASFERARQLNPDSESVLNNLARTRAIRDSALVSSSQ